MSLAQRFERRLESLVGGAFARVFKGQVEPVEIGTALQREATDKRNVMGNGQVMAPNRYRVTLSPTDHERLVPWEVQLTTSLAELLQEHLDENSWSTIGDIEVYLVRDDNLHTGVFGVASRMESSAPPRVRPHDSMSLPVIPGAPIGQYGGPAPIAAHLRPAPPVHEPYAPEPYAPQPYAPEPYAAEPYPAGPRYGQQAPQSYGQPYQPQPPRPPQALLIVDGTGQRYELHMGSNVVGRGSECDLQLLDQGVSRKHINIEYDGHVGTVYDLGSTNGTVVNGHHIGSHPLRHGDVVRLGHTKLVFQQEPM
ncbi:MAG: DUF3662 domain-containing protein [Actinobacteria bacterium]|nr:DUF3662 domain-containing protein [Actinomycetota bacterium]